MRQPEMKELAETIMDLCTAMKELGELEYRIRLTEEKQHKDMLIQDSERIKVRIAMAKLAAVKAKTSDGKCLLSFDKGTAEKFFSPIKHLMEIHSED